MRKTILIVTLMLPFWASAQINLEDIWLRYRFYPKFVESLNWMADGEHFSYLSTDTSNVAHIIRGQVIDGLTKDTLLSTSQLELSDSIGAPESFEIDKSGRYFLLQFAKERIYRRSSKAKFYIYDSQAQKGTWLATGQLVSNPILSPDGSQIGFVLDNNLCLQKTNELDYQSVTSSGKFNEIIHGMADWVYEEEFSFTKAFYWSTDSKQLAYLSFDESDVPIYHMQTWDDGLYPNDYAFKYPKAGEKNSIVTLSVFDLSSNSTQEVSRVTSESGYIPRVWWTPESDLRYLQMNRLQNHYDIKGANDESIYSEDSKAWIDLPEQIIFQKEGTVYLTSEKDGFNHIYRISGGDKKGEQLTSGKWEVKSIDKIVDDKIFYSANKGSSVEKHLFCVSTSGGKLKKLTKQKGTHTADIDPSGHYAIRTFSSSTTPPRTELVDLQTQKTLRILEDNAELAADISTLQLPEKKYTSMSMADGSKLNAWEVRPPDFDKSNKYPVLMHVYGGPGHQSVKESWGYFDQMWHAMLAQQGYIVLCVDGRGTGGKGRDFKMQTYQQLGKLETDDQISIAKQISEYSYVDASRIGIWGWSFGGYVSSLCITRGADIFKTAIAVAPVTNWRYYDTIYSERFLRTPKENAAGYDENSPVHYANLLKGNYLLVHGTGDDNVHFQNAIAMQNALIAANKQFDSFFYPDRNHGIYGGVTRYHLYKKMTDFILEKL